MTAKKNTSEGWGWSPASRVWHYYRDAMSLCRKIGFFFGEMEQGNDDSVDSCQQCRKILDRERHKKEKEQTRP